MKKIDTLFHTTKNIDTLFSIIENGFFPSYADEVIVGRNVKVLMISFSNVAFLESRSQINYGNYSIGFKRKWGEINHLHPVSYTYENSIISNMIDQVLEISRCGSVLSEMLDELKKNGSEKKFKSESLNSFNINYSKLDKNSIKELQNPFLDIFNKTSVFFPFFKNYRITNKEGIQIDAFNDREWRFIPDINPNELIIYEDSNLPELVGIINPRYIKINQEIKPHRKDIVLNFELNDLTNIIVNNKSEINLIYDILYKKFGNDKIDEAIKKGDLSINSIENISNNY
jgi:hypothetical protein